MTSLKYQLKLISYKKLLYSKTPKRLLLPKNLVIEKYKSHHLKTINFSLHLELGIRYLIRLDLDLCVR